MKGILAFCIALSPGGRMLVCPFFKRKRENVAVFEVKRS
jgi:hypothetical protein